MRMLVVTAMLAASALSAAPALADHLNLDLDGVKTDGAMITIPSAMIDKPGFVVIHAVVGGDVVVPASIGHAYIDTGTTENVSITADYPLKDGEDYIAMLHYDTNGDGEYSFGEGMTDVDTPALNAEEKPYVKPFKSGMGSM